MARSPSSSEQSLKEGLTPDEMQAGILRLGKRLEEVEAFDARSMSDRCPPELIALQAAVTRALERTFGAGSPDFKRFSSAGS
ncbi:hypothetical protein, partial [Methylobacterium soli]